MSKLVCHNGLQCCWARSFGLSLDGVCRTRGLNGVCRTGGLDGVCRTRGLDGVCRTRGLDGVCGTRGLLITGFKSNIGNHVMVEWVYSCSSETT